MDFDAEVEDELPLRGTVLADILENSVSNMETNLLEESSTIFMDRASSSNAEQIVSRLRKVNPTVSTVKPPI